jgi:hypothetical protein
MAGARTYTVLHISRLRERRATLASPSREPILFTRALLLVILLLGTMLPAHAQELQVTLTGQACPLNNCPTQGNASGSFTVSFDLDTLSEQQHFGFTNAQGIECVGEFDASDIAIENFSASVNGHALAAPSAMTASVGMNLNDGPCRPNSYNISIQAGNFAWTQAAGGTAISAAQLESMYDPFESMLLGHYANGAGGGTLLPDWTIRGTMSVTPVGVSEPSTWTLYLASLLVLALARRKSGAARQRCYVP